MDISVIIPAKDEEYLLPRCLDSIRTQSKQPSEVIVVANGCKDMTANIATNMGVRVIETNNPGVSKARNIGARASTCEILVFLDADSLLGPNILAEIENTVCKGAIGGSCNTWPIEKTLCNRMFWHFYNRLCCLTLRTNGMMFYRANDFLNCGGFPEWLTKGEDSYLHHTMIKLGKVVHLTNCWIETSMRHFESSGYLSLFLEWEVSFWKAKRMVHKTK